MKIITKRQQLVNDRIRTIFSIKNYPFFSIEESQTRKRYYLFNLKVLSLKSKVGIETQLTDRQRINKDIRCIDGNKLILWFDHCLGGGTEVYSQRVIAEEFNKATVLRIQFIWSQYCFKLTLISAESNKIFYLFSLSELKDLLLSIRFFQLIVNNLVGYKNSLSILELVKELKSKNESLKVKFNLHDYHCICPSYNLIFKNKEFCNLEFSKCNECFSSLRLSENEKDNRILLSGSTDVKVWRSNWKDFLCNVCDEILAFSEGSKDILLRAYPEIEKKITVRPHNVPMLRMVGVNKHRGLNIAFLGEIGLTQKGSNVVKDLAKYSSNRRNINLYVIGEYINPPKGLKVTGRYKLNYLPNLIEKLKIDMIVIPSIWPETFSFTTSEAIQLGIPVACFNYGAQAEKVKKYSKGLILTNRNPKSIIQEIESYFKNKPL